MKKDGMGKMGRVGTERMKMTNRRKGREGKGRGQLAHSHSCQRDWFNPNVPPKPQTQDPVFQKS